MSEENKETETTESNAPAGVSIKAGDNYVKGKTAEGKSTQHNGDPVAVALGGLKLEETYAVASEMLGVSVDDLKNGHEAVAAVKADEDEGVVGSKAIKAFKGYGHLNNGMQRMALGNKLRALVKKDNALEESEGLEDTLVALCQAESKDRLEAKAEADRIKAPQDKTSDPVEVEEDVEQEEELDTAETEED